MPSKNKNIPVAQKAWSDTWKWLLNAKMGWIAAIIVGGLMGGIFVGSLFTERVFAGFVGSIITICLIFGITFIVHLIITPYRLRKENRHKFIENNASYVSRFLGNPTKQKYLTILGILESMIKIENEVTDNMAGKHQATNREIKEMQIKFNQRAKVPLLPLSKAINIYLSGDLSKKVDQTINKLGLGIVGDKPTDNQTEFFIKARSVLDESGFGLSNGLGKSSEYTELLKKFYELVPEINDNTPDWIFFLLVYPSGFNSAYLYWGCQGKQRQHLLYSKRPMPILLEYKSQRESAINQIIKYAKDSIEEM